MRAVNTKGKSSNNCVDCYSASLWAAECKAKSVLIMSFKTPCGIMNHLSFLPKKTANIELNQWMMRCSVPLGVEERNSSVLAELS